MAVGGAEMIASYMASDVDFVEKRFITCARATLRFYGSDVSSVFADSFSQSYFSHDYPHFQQ